MVYHSNMVVTRDIVLDALGRRSHYRNRSYGLILLLLSTGYLQYTFRSVYKTASLHISLNYPLDPHGNVLER